MNWKWMILGCANFFLFLCLLISTSNADKQESDFPLSQGTYWVYQGTVKWTGVNNNFDKVLTTKVTIKMEVKETYQRDSIFMAVMQGHPADVDWYEGKVTPHRYLILRKDSHRYYLIPEEMMDNILKRVKDEKDDLKNLLPRLMEPAEDFNFPLTSGKIYGEDTENPRSDNLYCWVVESEKHLFFKNIKGINPKLKLSQYRLTYRSLPDHIFIDFVPGVGITRYIYSHHGEVSETDVHLIEYHPAE